MAMRYLEHKPWIVHACNRVVNLKLVQSFLIVVIVVNTLALSADHYTIAPATIAKLNIANTVFSCIFGLEMLLKLLGRLGCTDDAPQVSVVSANVSLRPYLPYARSFSVSCGCVGLSSLPLTVSAAVWWAASPGGGPTFYFSSYSNWFDAAIVVSSFAEIAVEGEALPHPSIGVTAWCHDLEGVRDGRVGAVVSRRLGRRRDRAPILPTAAAVEAREVRPVPACADDHDLGGHGQHLVHVRHGGHLHLHVCHPGHAR